MTPSAVWESTSTTCRVKAVSERTRRTARSLSRESGVTRSEATRATSSTLPIALGLVVEQYLNGIGVHDSSN
jgi:hypothetical protein